MRVVSPSKDSSLSTDCIALVLTSVDLADWELVKLSSDQPWIFNHEFKLLIFLVLLLQGVLVHDFVLCDLKLSKTKLTMVVPTPCVNFPL